MYPFGSLPVNLVAFCGVLRREHGFHIGPGDVRDAARALEIIDLHDERAVRYALRPTLSRTVDEAKAETADSARAVRHSVSRGSELADFSCYLRRISHRRPTGNEMSCGPGPQRA